MTLKKPSELFEQRRLESLAEESAKKEKSQVKNKRIISPKELFGEVVEVEELSVVEEVVEIKVEDTAKEDLTGFVEEKIGKQTEEIQERLKEKFEEYSEQFEDRTKKNYQNLSNQFNSVKENLIKKVSNLEVDILRNEKHLRNNNVDVDEIRQDINETIQKIKSEIIEDVGVLQEPPSNVTSDPLTPLDKNFVTLDQLQEHYRLFINRIQQQLTTLGGGGETRLEFLDDVDRNSAKINGRFLKYDAASGKWVGAAGATGGTALTVKESIGNGGTENLSVDNVNTIIFDNSTGFNVTDNGDGEVFVNLGSSFATWYIDGSDDLHATGEDAVEFVAGPGIAISTKSTSTGIGTGLSKSITITSTGGGNSGYATTAGIATYASYATIAGYSTSSGIATYATSSGIATYAINAGVSTYATISGISTYSGISGIATYATTSGISTYSGISGIATYATTSGISTYSGISGIATYATSSGIATVSQGLSGTPNIIVGIVTATKYYGDGSSLTGISAGGITSTSSINTTGIITANSYYVGSTQVINSAGQWVGSGLSVYSNIDAGAPNSVYGGIPVIDGGVP